MTIVYPGDIIRLHGNCFLVETVDDYMVTTSLIENSELSEGNIIFFIHEKNRHRWSKLKQFSSTCLMKNMWVPL